MCAGNELFFVALYVRNFLTTVDDLWWFTLLLIVSGTICFAKQFINVVQIVNASRVLASIDLEDRERKALTAKKE
ncbi:hypothetical protein DFQ28_009282 [Apophysomyces sp. BC1034]|nr:hypothetical protein DFQ30_009032 [Apophysomyces sp. BC1015]KAG0173292.1 hypothetical protein DFQ29_008022 [Apophysomyces sp. BC1021]KAG0185466.1 hypothetical protein DFQ28_009282 [Apophysomyces sp. BC1034]